MNEQRNLMKNVQMHALAMFDAHLFLDSHPNSKQAIAYFKKQRMLYNQAVAEYEKRFGPLQAGGQTGDDSWEWVNGPWPWEYME